MSKIDRYAKSLNFVTSNLTFESKLLEDVKPKLRRDFTLKKHNIFIEIYDYDFLLTNKNEIIFYPYTVKFIYSKGNTIKIPIFLEKPSLLIVLLRSKNIKFKEIEIKDPEEELSDKELQYYRHEKVFVSIRMKC